MGGVLNTAGSLLGGAAGSLGNAAGATSNFQASLDPQTLAQQQAFVQALQAQMAGTGPSVAQNQLNQATNTNLSNAMGMAASARGVNPALAARQAQQSGAMMNQQAAGQAATMRAQEQLGAQNMLGNQLNSMQTQNLQMQGVNANTAAQNAQTQGQIVGGMLGGIGSAAGAGAGGKYNGGMVGYADGGSVQPRSSITNYLLNPVMAAAQGNTVPGQPLVPGDNPVNDVVPAMLSPKEIVIPNSITMGKNAGEAAKKFVEAELAKSKKKDSSGYAEGGVVSDNILGDTISSLNQQIPNAPAANPYADFERYIQAKPLATQSEIEAAGIKTPPSLFQRGKDAVMEIRNDNLAKENALAGVKPPEPSPVTTEIPQAPSVQPNAISAPVDTMGIGVQTNALMKGIGQQKAGLQQEAAATGALGEEQAKQLEAQNQQIQARQVSFEQATAKLNEHRQALLQDLQENKINPNQYYDSLSTGGKVSTLVGLVLGGIGGGMTGKGGNMALDTFNNMVNRDLEAQKSNLDKKKGLLAANLQEMGNLRDAETFSRIQMNDAFANQLKASAAKAQGPIAQARALQMAGQIDQQNAQLMGTLAMKQSLMGQQGNIPPEKLINVVVPEGERPKAREELSKITAFKAATQDIAKSFGEAALIGGIQGNIPLTAAKTKMSVIGAKLYGVARQQMKGQGALSDQEVEQGVQPFIPVATDTQAQLNEKKKGFIDFLTNNIQGGFPILKSYNIPINLGTPGLTPQEQKYLNWAKQQDPKNPDAQKIIQRLAR